MDYTTLLVLDCKTALWETAKKRPFDQTNEIIAIDVAVVDTAKNSIIEQETVYVRPKKAKVSAYCESIFGITQNQLDISGIPFDEAYRKLRIHYMSRDRLWGSWGRLDQYTLDAQCKSIEIETLFTTSHLDLQHLSSLMIGLSGETKYLSLDEAIKYCELKRSKNDAVDAANIFMRMAKGLRPLKTRIVVPTNHQTLFKSVN